MMRIGIVLLAVLGLGAILPAASAPSPQSAEADLRVVGKVTAKSTSAADGSVRTVFACESPERAKKLASKLMADLKGFGDDAGLFQVTSRGNFVEALFGPGAPAYEPAAAGLHPHWFDHFDNAALSMGALGWGNLSMKDYRAGFAWIGEQGWDYIAENNNANMQAAPGVWDFTVSDFYGAWAKKYGTGFQTYLPWAHPHNPAWFWNEIPLPYAEPRENAVMSPMLDRQKLAMDSPFARMPKVDGLLATKNATLSARLARDDGFAAHFGVPEIGHDFLVMMPGIGQCPDQSGIASMAEIVGGPASERFDLRGTWKLRAPGPNAPTEIDCNDPVLMLWNRNDSTRLGRFFTLSAAEVARLRYLHVSVNAWHLGRPPMPEVTVNGRPAKNLTDAHTLTGDEDRCWDLAGLLVEGQNKIVIDTHGQPIPYYIFLSPNGRWTYPSDDPVRNRLFFDAIEKTARVHFAAVRDWLAAFRAGDPEGRPILAMAAWEVIDLSYRAFRELGVYGHETGQCQDCWAPWHPRYYMSHGLPVSSEPGGAPRDAAGLQKMMTLFTIMGTDSVNFLFDPTSYWPNGMREWIASHRESLRCLGKLEMPRAQVGVLRSVRNASRLRRNGPWCNDPSRGAVQAAGRSVGLCDLCDFTDGSVATMFDTVIDACTDVMTEDEVEGIARFVENGGTFIAMPDTGYHSAYVKGARPFARRLLVGEPQENAGFYRVWRHGKGRVVQIGPGFVLHEHDTNGKWGGDPSKCHLADLLDRLGVARSSLGARSPGGTDVFSEVWRSKNGLYDLFLVAQVNSSKGTVVSPTFFAPGPVEKLVELSAEGHPEQAFTFSDGQLTLKDLKLGPMEFRLFASLRSDAGYAPLAWLKSLEKRWYRLPKLAAADLPKKERPLERYLSLADGWRHVESGKTVRLGSFIELGLPEESTQHFEKTFEIPAGWKGREPKLVFECEYWFWGIAPNGTVKVNGKPVLDGKVFGHEPNGAFTVPLPDTGSVRIEIEIVGAIAANRNRTRPTGVTGVFYAEAKPGRVLEKFELKDFHPYVSAVETRFATPMKKGRWWLETAGPLGWLQLNGKFLCVPGHMNAVDVSGLLRRDGGENVLRWWPGRVKETPHATLALPKTIPPLCLKRIGNSGNSGGILGTGPGKIDCF